jgi:hypothetical protein
MKALKPTKVLPKHYASQSFKSILSLFKHCVQKYTCITYIFVHETNMNSLGLYQDPKMSIHSNSYQLCLINSFWILSLKFLEIQNMQSCFKFEISLQVHVNASFVNKFVIHCPWPYAFLNRFLIVNKQP